MRGRQQQLDALRLRRSLIDEAITALEDAQRLDCGYVTQLIHEAANRLLIRKAAGLALVRSA